MDPNFNTGTPETDQTLLKSLIVFACLMEGLFFYVGFTQILALGRQNKMTGAAEQYQYILRDESMHCNFGIDLINQLKLENPQLWTPEFKAEIKALFEKAVELEYRYAEDTMPRGVLGMNASMFKGYLRYIANRRATQIGLEAAVPQRGKSVPLDERNDRPEEGTQLLRNPRDRVPVGRRAVLGLKSHQTMNSRITQTDDRRTEASRVCVTRVHGVGIETQHHESLHAIQLHEVLFVNLIKEKIMATAKKPAAKKAAPARKLRRQKKQPAKKVASQEGAGEEGSCQESSRQEAPGCEESSGEEGPLPRKPQRRRQLRKKRRPKRQPRRKPRRRKRSQKACRQESSQEAGCEESSESTRCPQSSACPAAPAAQTTLNPQAAWPFPTASKP